MQSDSRHPFKADPYRAARKPPSPDGYYESPSFSSDQIHSRSPSESSTTRLAVSSSSHNINNNSNKPSSDIYGGEEYDYYNQQDPYAPRQGGEKKKKKRNNRNHQQQYNQQQDGMYHNNEKRANSYLPYSNHKRDPYDPVEPIYLQEEVDDLPSFNSPGGNRGVNNGRGPVGSILQDNIAMDMMNEDQEYYAPSENHGAKKEESLEPLPAIKKKRWWSKLGLSGRKLVFIIFAFIVVVVIIGYFVWPRDPTLTFSDAGLVSDANYNSTSMIATWNVNFTVNNEVNWIPTNINNFAVSVIDATTEETFGSGNSGHLMLKPKSLDEVITVPIYINFVRDPTNPTLQDLLNACRVINQDLTAPKQTLNIKFSIIYYIAGMVKHTRAVVFPATYFSCPTPES